MKRAFCLSALLCCVAVTSANADPPFKPLVTGLKSPSGVAIGPDGRTYVSVADGTIMVIDKGMAVAFVTGLDHPFGIAVYQKWLFVADKDCVWKIDLNGKKEVFASADSFPVAPTRFWGIVADPETGTLYVSDVRNVNSKSAGAIYCISSKGKADLLVDDKSHAKLKSPTGLAMDGASFLLAVDPRMTKYPPGYLFRIKIRDKLTEEINEADLRRPTGVAWDHYGRLYISNETNKIVVIPRPGEHPILLAQGFDEIGGICLDASGKSLLVSDPVAGTITAVPCRIPGWEVDDTPLPLETAVAFPDLKWAGWTPETPSGKINSLRPLVLTHAGDGSNRVFVATQQGVVHVFPNDQKADQTKIFLDIQKRVVYNDNANEEGLLGLAFHPNFKKTGEFFAFYTPKNQKPPHTNVVSRFRVSKDDPDKADPDFEEELLRIEHKNWNHDGGTILFGPDGYLYIAIGDGGGANDPDGNGQNLKTLLAKVLRIDVDHKDPGKNYAIPKDNPFVDRPDARPEVWAYGLRNVWRMSFDRKTHKLWASDVGQNLYEEIDHIVKGGNYGWSVREGMHPFGKNGSGPRADLVEPIWEYHHNVGKSLTGGNVYRGKKLPDLDGAYLYADYVTGKIWALRYDDAKKRVVSNQTIRDKALPIMSFGEDEQGEVYMMTYSNAGRGIYQFVRQK